MSELDQAVRAVVRDCLGVSEGEDVLVVCNRATRGLGELLEDEKLLGTAHVAFGASAAIGGTVQVPVHLDCLVLKPDLSVDGEAVVRNGSLVL